MVKKLFLILLIFSFLITNVAASQVNLGTFKQGEDVTLLQICGTCTFNNITSVVLPNSTHLQLDASLTKRGPEFSYIFNQTDLKGVYLVNGFGDLAGTDSAWAYTFTITTTGHEFNNSKSIFYIGVMGILVFFFIITLIAIKFLPDRSETNDQGSIMSINSLSHLKLVFGGVAWGILTMINFLAMNVASAYLETELVVSIFRVLFTFNMVGLIIAIPVILIYTITKVVEDNVIKQMIERDVMQ